MNLVGVVQGTITPADAASFPINNDGSLSIYTSMTTGAITGDAQLLIGGPFAPAVKATLQIAPNSGGSEISSLTIASGCTLDITNTHVIIDDITPAKQASIMAYLASGYNGGTWNGTGIISSTAAASSGYYGVGMAGAGVVHGLTSGQLEIAYALYGDTNLDGVVDGSDFTTLVTNLGKSVSGGWQDGDFTYDGIVTGTDFSLLASNFGKTANGTSVVLPSSDWAALDAYEAANGLAISNIPEPASTGLLAVAGLRFLTRRRRDF
jgi:hypothetical protein